MYPELTAFVGNRVPDYRGIFLRDHGSQISAHYGTVVHSSAGLGELQGDAIRNITGTFGSFAPSYRADAFANGVFYMTGAVGDVQDGSAPDYKNTVGVDASRMTPVAQEIRPVNRAVRYLIRA